MALDFISLKISWEGAITALPADGGVPMWLPAALGGTLIGQVRTIELSKPSKDNAWFVRVPALILGTIGMLNLAKVLAPSLAGLLSPLAPLSPVLRQEAVAMVLTGLALLLLANGLWRRKRATWFVTVALMIVSTTILWAAGDNPSKTFIGAALAVWLALSYPYMSVKSDQGSVKRGVYSCFGIFTLTLLISLVSCNPLSTPAEANNGFWHAARLTAAGFALFDFPVAQCSIEPRTLFAPWVCLGGAAAWLAASYFCLQPVRAWRSPSPAARSQARAIVERHGRSSMAYFALLRDKIYYFSKGGSLIAYAVHGRVAVILGDPIGPAEDIAAAIAEFQSLCTQNDWVPAFCLTMPNNLEHYKQAGFRHICMGHEGVVDLHTFHLRGRSSSNFRKRYHRFQRQGYQLVLHEPPIHDEVLDELRIISGEWLERVYGREKQFFLGWFEDEYIRSSRVCTVRNPKGEISAFANLIPEFQLNEVSVDMVRFKRNMAPGTMDFLFVSLFYWAREQGFDTFNLGLSALAKVGERGEDPFLERIIHLIYRHGSWYYDFQGLYEFKRKFHPAWQPQFLVYPGYSNLPAVCLAMAQVNAGGKWFSTYRDPQGNRMRRDPT